MRILFLAQIIPYPPDAGPKVKTWHVLRYLVSRGHQVTLAAFIRPEEEEFLPIVAQLCHRVHTVPIRRSKVSDVGFMLRSFITGRPFLIERDDLAAMRSLVRELLAQEAFDVVHADQLTMAQFALDRRRLTSRKPKLIFDAHNAVWTIVDRMAQNAPLYLKPLLRLEAERVKRYESQLVCQADRVLAVTELDKTALLAGSPDHNGEARAKISVIPIAVDTHQIQPVASPPNSKTIFTLGTLHYPPNADGIRWFLQQVLPIIRQHEPGATLTIVGKNPPPDFIEMANRFPGVIEVTGYVPDLKPYLTRSAVVVVPVRAGGGMRVRILEAFAYGMPVVTTTVGLEGIEAKPDFEVLVADTPQDFAREVIRVLEDATLRARLSANGRELVERQYDWQVVLKELDRVYEALAE